MKYERTAELRAASRLRRGNSKTGRFGMTLATDGEASDGHILCIAGGVVPDKLPLQVSHANDPTLAAGSIIAPRKVLDAVPQQLRATGQIELGGTGPNAEIRRDLAHMIDAGHVRAVSLRWDDIESVARVNLPSDHPAHVARGEKNPRKRQGLYFKRWRAMEGSIVALGADPEAMVGRSKQTRGAVSTFWRGMAADARARSVLDRIPGVANLSVDEIRAKLAAGWFRAEMAKTPEGREFLRCLDDLVEVDCLASVSAIALAGAERADRLARDKYDLARAGKGRVDDQTAGWHWREAHGRLENARARHAALQERRSRAAAELQVAGQWF